MNGNNNARLTIFLCALLIGVTFAVFWPLLSSEFVTYDDPPYVTENDHITTGLNAENVKWAFSNNKHGGNWHPVTSLSHMLDVQLFGLKPGRHHLVNLLFHVLDSVLLLLLQEHGVEDVKQQIDQMMPSRLQPEKLHIEHVRQRGHWMPITSVFVVTKSPLYIFRIQAGGNVIIFRDVRRIVVCDKFTG